MLNTTGKGMSRAAQKRRKITEKIAVKAIRHDEVDDNEVVCDEENDLAEDLNKLQNSANVNTGSDVFIDGCAISEPLHFNRFQNILSHLNKKDANTYPEIAKSLLYFMTDPGGLENFYKSYWGRKLYHSNHKKHNHFKGIINRSDIETALKTHSLCYYKDIIVSSSRNVDSLLSGVKVDYDELGNTDIRYNNLWQNFEEGESICWLTSSQYSENIWKFLSLLELEFESVVNCQVFLISPHGTGFPQRCAFADMFVLQIEGNSSWKIKADSSPQGDSIHTSADGNEKDDKNLKITLRQGDCIYIPKSYVFETSFAPGKYCEVHSLYLIIYTNEFDSYPKMLEMIVPRAIEETMTSNHPLTGDGELSRRLLPRKSFSYLGVAHTELEEDQDEEVDDKQQENSSATVSANKNSLLQKRNAFFNGLKVRLEEILKAATSMSDAAVDQVKKQFIIDRLPVPLTPAEEKYSSYGFSSAVIGPYTSLRMIRPHIACAVVEDGKILVYHCMDNSREVYSSSVSPLEFDLDDGPAIEELLAAYPHSQVVSELTHTSEELDDKMSIAHALYKEGFLLVTDDATRSGHIGGGTDNSDDDDDDESDDDIF